MQKGGLVYALHKQKSCAVNIKAISPAQQTVEQAKSGVKREDISVSNTQLPFHSKPNQHRGRTRRKSETAQAKGVNSIKKATTKGVNSNQRKVKNGKSS